MARYDSLDDFVSKGAQALKKGPFAIILVEDNVEIASTINHCLKLGFKAVIALMDAAYEIEDEFPATVHRIDYDIGAPLAVSTAVNRISQTTLGAWFYYGFNAEYLMFPFVETRNIAELLTFHTEERRDAMLTYIVDLYAPDLEEAPDAVNLERAHLDSTGYYALARKQPTVPYHPLERQLDFYGGLRWRFEEHVPYERRRIDRIGIFRAAPGLELREDHTFTDEEYNTYSCPWHHNLTAAICSFRTAKALKRNPGSSKAIDSFIWSKSVPFEWSSTQLMDLGLMEPGQWF